jgi:Fe-S cluster biogenesis protein NfuA
MARNLREGTLEINAGGGEPPNARAVRAALDGVRPGLIADGGNVELVSVEEDGTVCVEFQGACSHCPALGQTLQLVVEPSILKQVPQATAVIVASRR